MHAVIAIIIALAVGFIAIAIAVVRLSGQVQVLRTRLDKLREDQSATRSVALQSAVDVSECKGRINALSEAVIDNIRRGADNQYRRNGDPSQAPLLS